MTVVADLRQSRPYQYFLTLALVLAIGGVDYLSGYQLAFSLFYVIPIGFATWVLGRRPGLVISALSAIVWLVADLASGHPYDNSIIPLWNTMIRGSFFIIITLLLAALADAHARERELARTDALTGAVNSRSFFELIEGEIERAQRYRRPFTVAYLDLDNFKTVNDRFGHAAGDEALRVVVDFAKRNLRRVDVVARMGGDEFALLLPETNEDAARAAISHLQEGLLAEMKRRGWPITFSVGVLTCATSPPGFEAILRTVDEMMYSVKRGEKNAVVYAAVSD